MGNSNIFEKIKLPNLIIIIIIIIVGFNIYKDQTKSIEALKEKIKVEEEKNAVLKELSGLRGKLDAYMAILARKEVRLFMSSIQNSAKDSGVAISSIKPRNEQVKEDYVIVPFDLTVTAPNYHALAKFISKLENSKDVYFVDSGDIIETGSGDGLKANMVVSSIIMDELKLENTKK